MAKSRKYSGFSIKIKGFLRFFKIDFSFFLVFAISFFLEEVSLFFCFVAFLIMHELAHFFVAKRLGYMAKCIKLNFFGASLEGYDDFLLSDEIKIILAGPMLNLGVLILCYMLYWFEPESYHYLCEVEVANKALLAFNVLPVFPLDAGRLIHALLSKKLTRGKSLQITKRISLAALLVMFGLFLISFFYELNFTFGFVIVNLAFLLFSSAKDTSYKREIFAKRKFKLIDRGLVEKNIYVSRNTPAYSLLKFIDDYHFTNFMILDEEHNLVDSLSEVELYHKLHLLE